MRFRDLLSEDNTVDEIMNDLMDIIITFKRKREKSIPMHGKNGLIFLLHRVGYDVTPENIMKTLTNPKFNELVKRSSTNDVELKVSIPDTEVSDEQKKKSEKNIDKLAKKATHKKDKTDQIAKKASAKALKSGELK